MGTNDPPKPAEVFARKPGQRVQANCVHGSGIPWYTHSQTLHGAGIFTDQLRWCQRGQCRPPSDGVSGIFRTPVGLDDVRSKPMPSDWGCPRSFLHTEVNLDLEQLVYHLEKRVD